MAEMDFAQVKAVIFDMDGLMFDTERLGINAYAQAGEEFGYDINEEFVLQCVGRTARDSEGLFRERFGTDFPYETIRNRRLDIANQWMTVQGIPIKQGLLLLLDYLEQAGIPKAVATSTERSRAEGMLKAAGVYNRFDVIVCGDEVLTGKPAPDIFLLAAQKLDCPPATCLVLEDSSYGIQAAAHANIPSILIPDVKAPPPEVTRLAVAVVDSLLAVRDLLGGLA